MVELENVAQLPKHKKEDGSVDTVKFVDSRDLPKCHPKSQPRPLLRNLPRKLQHQVTAQASRPNYLLMNGERYDCI